MQEQAARQALLVLPGLTADRPKLDFLARFFSEHTTYVVYVADIPRRRGLEGCAHWLDGYLQRVVQPDRYQGLQVLAYISGGIVLRRLWATWSTRRLARVVYVRSPIQELTLRVLRERYGRLMLWLLRGQLTLDVAATDMRRLGYPGTISGQGLIIETGVSRLARSLGVGPERVPGVSWEPDQLLPGADDVIRVQESHDEVYTSPGVLGQALQFFEHGRFWDPMTRTAKG